MAKKKIEIRREYLEKIMNDKIIVEYTKVDQERNLEEEIDDKVKNNLKVYLAIKWLVKTRIMEIDRNVLPYHGDDGSGHLDVMLFNYFNDNEIDIIWKRRNNETKSRNTNKKYSN